MKNFLKWWIFQSVSLVGVYFCWEFDVFKTIWEVDSTYLCFLIMFIYLVSTLYIGKAAYKLDKNKVLVNTDRCWFAAEVMMAAGMWGTILGLLMCLNHFSLVDVSNQQSMSQLIKSMAQSMGISAWTTVVGLLLAVLTKVQCYYLEQQTN